MLTPASTFMAMQLATFLRRFDIRKCPATLHISP